MKRREFIRYAGATLASLAVPRFPIPEWCPGERTADPAPAPFGRITTWWRQGIYSEASSKSEWKAWKTKDEVIPLYATVQGEAPWPTNPTWYQTNDGFIHSGYVQPVENTPNSEILTEVTPPGFWAQVCMPFAQAKWKMDSKSALYRLYYGTVYRVVNAAQDEEGNWWYQLQDGVTFKPGPYVPAWSVRRIPPTDLFPISPRRADKWIQIDIAAQTLTCYEGEIAVFQTGVSTGTQGRTPRGEFRVLYKRHTRRMIGGEGDDYYDLPGVSFPVYFTRAAHAIHGTYWHNDFTRPHSHGCVNVSNQAAQWIFRWTDPIVPYHEYERKVKEKEESTRIVIV